MTYNEVMKIPVKYLLLNDYSIYEFNGGVVVCLLTNSSIIPLFEIYYNNRIYIKKPNYEFSDFTNKIKSCSRKEKIKRLLNE